MEVYSVIGPACPGQGHGCLVPLRHEALDSITDLLAISKKAEWRNRSTRTGGIVQCFNFFTEGNISIKSNFDHATNLSPQSQG